MRRLVPKSIFYSVLSHVPSSHTLPLTLILLSSIATTMMTMTPIVYCVIGVGEIGNTTGEEVSSKI